MLRPDAAEYRRALFHLHHELNVRGGAAATAKSGAGGLNQGVRCYDGSDQEFWRSFYRPIYELPLRYHAHQASRLPAPPRCSPAPPSAHAPLPDPPLPQSTSCSRAPQNLKMGAAEWRKVRVIHTISGFRGHNKAPPFVQASMRYFDNPANFDKALAKFFG